MDEPESSPSWIFDTIGKKSLVQRLYTVMSGSVVATGTAGDAKRRKTTPKAKAASTSTRGTRTTTKPDDMSSLAQAIPNEPGVESTTVSCAWGVRNKLWVDDLMMCVNHIINALQKELRDNVDDFVFAETKRQLIRLGLVFAFTGEVNIATHKTPAKAYKKWSAVRIALRGHAVLLLTKARFCFRMFYVHVSSFVHSCSCGCVVIPF